MKTQYDLILQTFLFASLLFAMWNLFPWMQALGHRIFNQLEPSYRRSHFNERWRLSRVYQHAFW
jgi:hypothetical protein